MTSETSQLVPALPVRRRETLEIFDTALKLYRRYFWVLIGWSALVSVIAFVPFLSFFSLFTSPLLFGAVSCCVAAAVRGQKVDFSQCWHFSKPRYGAMLGTWILGFMIFGAIGLVLYIATIFSFFLGALVLSQLPSSMAVVLGIVGFLVIMVLYSVLGVAAFGWLNMIPIVVCLEDDKRGTAAMGRAYELLKGHWRRVFGMSLIIGLAMGALMGIVGGMLAFVGALRFNEIFGANPSESSIWMFLLTMGGFVGLFSLLWNPAQSLIIAILYLDLRVRKEALDLEWVSYASAPPVPVGVGAIETPSVLGANSFAASVNASGAMPEATPASFAASGAVFSPPAVENVTAENTAVEHQPVAESPTVKGPTFIASPPNDFFAADPVVTSATIGGVSEPAETVEQIEPAEPINSAPVVPVVPPAAQSLFAPPLSTAAAEPVSIEEMLEPFEIKPLNEDSQSPPTIGEEPGRSAI